MHKRNIFFRNVPPGATVNWVSSNVLIATVNNQGLVTRTGSANGTVRITGTITLPCGTHVIEFKDILVGSANSLNGTYSTNTTTKPIQTVNAVPSGYINAQYQWPSVTNITATLGSGSSSGTGFNSYGTFFNFSLTTGQSISINFNGTGICGPVNATRVFYQSSYSSFSITASPNPATNNINVTIIKGLDTTLNNLNTLASVAKSNNKGTTKMYLYEFNTNLLIRQWTYQEIKAMNYNLNIAGIKSGYYILKMERDNKTATTKILVQ